MVKYVTTAIALKGFSFSPLTRSLYRGLGNRFGNKKRGIQCMPPYYPERLKRMVRLQKEHKIVQEGDRIIELGTGWLHWEALTLRLFCKIEAVLFDVWDNRQLDGLKNYIRQLKPMLDAEFGLTQVELKQAQSLIDSILKTKSFAELYDLLGFEYVVEGNGSVAQFPSNSFQLVVSGGVLEHVKRESLSKLISETQRVLKPGGWAVHSIDTADHLEHYDRKVSPKMYLSFSDRTWTRLFENEVQYINRVQRGEWLDFFGDSGFKVVEEEARRVDISNLSLANRYKHMERTDLECTVFKVVLRKPKSLL